MSSPSSIVCPSIHLSLVSHFQHFIKKHRLDRADTWWEAWGRHQDSELLKMLCGWPYHVENFMKHVWNIFKHDIWTCSACFDHVMNMFEYDLTCALNGTMVKHDQICLWSIMYNHVYLTCSNMISHASTWLNRHDWPIQYMVRICPNMLEHVKETWLTSAIYSQNMAKHVRTCSDMVETCSNIFKF